MIHQQPTPIALGCFFGCLFGCLVGSLFGCLAGTVSAQTPKPTAAKRDPWVKGKIEEYKELITDGKGAKDAAAIEVINELLGKYRTMHPSDQRDFARGISWCLTSSWCRRKPGQTDIYRATVKALSLTGRNGSTCLRRAFDDEAFHGREWIPLRGEMLEKIGVTKDEKQVAFLLKTALNSPDDTLMARAGGALRHFGDLKLEKRRDIAKSLIKKFAEIHDSAHKDLDPGNGAAATWRARLAAVSSAWNRTLTALTGQRHRTVGDWTTFWNKHKNDDWDKPPKKTR